MQDIIYKLTDIGWQLLPQTLPHSTPRKLDRGLFLVFTLQGYLLLWNGSQYSFDTFSSANGRVYYTFQDNGATHIVSAPDSDYNTVICSIAAYGRRLDTEIEQKCNPFTAI